MEMLLLEKYGQVYMTNASEKSPTMYDHADNIDFDHVKFLARGAATTASVATNRICTKELLSSSIGRLTWL
jgi:hypothetical protein